jgi:hypothetical protein
LRESKRRRSFYFSEKRKQQRSGTISKAKLGHGFRGSQQEKKSVRYGFGTAAFIFLVQAVQQHETKKKGAFNDPYRSYGRRTAATKFWARFSRNPYSI